MNNPSPSDPRSGGRESKVTGTLKTAAERVQEKAQEASGRMSELATESRKRVEPLRKEAVAKMKEGNERFHQGMEQHPLAMGIGFMALGFLLGVAFPRSMPENRAMGSLAEQVKEKGREAGEKMITASKEAANRAVESVRGETNQTMGAGMSS